MNLGTHPFRAALAVAAAGCLIAGVAQPATAAPPDAVPAGVPQLEALDRGLVAVSTSEGVFLSWRLLGSEATGATDTGLAGPDFAVYRDGEQVATVTDSTNYLDPAGTATSQYTVAPVVTASSSRQPPRSRPGRRATTTCRCRSRPTASPRRRTGERASLHLLGQRHVASATSTATARTSTSSSGTRRTRRTSPRSATPARSTSTPTSSTARCSYRIDLGVNIRAGAHYTQFLVYDFDGDGRAEMMLKTAPGTKIDHVRRPTARRVASGTSRCRERTSRPATRHDDDYRLSAADYYEHLVDMFQGWTEHPEVVAGHWPATLEEAWGIPRDARVPAVAARAPRRSPTTSSTSTRRAAAPATVLRNFEGFIVDGPEYLTVFDGATGEELQTIDYKPGRDDDGLMWGDYAMARIEPGNRVDRFLSGVAYLDGEHPSAVFARGYYTRTTLAAYDWDGRHLDGALVRRQRPRADDATRSTTARTAATAPTPSTRRSPRRASTR